MVRPRLDPLLAGARLLLALSKAVMLLLAAGCAIGAVAMVVMRQDILPDYIRDGLAPGSLWPIVVILLLIMVGGLLGYFFFRHLDRIVGTVGQGDPFIPINAERLSAMGWIALATHLLVIVVMAIGSWIEANSRGGEADIDFSIFLGGLLLALILFVLSRVFREGTRLRDELEGTV